MWYVSSLSAKVYENTVYVEINKFSTVKHVHVTTQTRTFMTETI